MMIYAADFYYSQINMQTWILKLWQANKIWHDQDIFQDIEIQSFPVYGRPSLKTCGDSCRNPGYGSFLGYGNFPVYGITTSYTILYNHRKDKTNILTSI